MNRAFRAYVRRVVKSALAGNLDAKGTRWTHDFKEWNEDDPPEDPLNHRRATYCYQFRRTILNGREAEFITGMIAQSLHRRLTPRQAEWLEAIWRKCQPFNFDDVT